MNIVFAGTPFFSQVCLQQILSEPTFKVSAVYTQADKPAGRGQKTQPSLVKTLALEQNIPVYTPNTLKTSAEIKQLEALNPDVMLVVAYGMIIPKEILVIPRYGCINIHASLLPRWRGASPIQQAILAGDAQTGVAIMQMDEGLDTGPVLMQQAISIAPSDTTSSLSDKLLALSKDLLMKTLLNFAHAVPMEAVPQDTTTVTYAPKIEKTAAKINWYEPADKIERCIRAYNPWPIAYTEIQGIPVKIHEAKAHLQFETKNQVPGMIIQHTENGIFVSAGNNTVLELLVLQLPNRKKLSVKALLAAQKALFALGAQFISADTKVA